MKASTFLKRVFSASCLFLPFTQAHAQIPFDVSKVNYVYIGTAGMNAGPGPAMLHTTATADGSGTFSAGIPITGTADKLNGAGLNPADGFLYAQAFQTNAGVPSSKLYRIGADGVAAQVGTIPAPSNPAATFSMVNVSAGMADANGDYWFMGYSYTGNPFSFPYNVSNFQVYMGRLTDVAALPAGTGVLSGAQYFPVDISDPILQTAFQSFLNAFDYSNPGYSDGGVQDIALNPADRQFYGYFSYPDPGNPTQLLHRAFMVNSLSWTATPIGTAVGTQPAANEMSGAYFDPAGNFYVLFTDGQFTHVNTTTGTADPFSTSNLPVSGGNLRGDLASNVTVVPLPVVLQSFSGASSGSGNVLRWVMADQSDLARFELLRSNDGRNFSSLGTVVTGDNKEYSYTDVLPAARSFYKLRMTTTSGRTSESNVVLIASKAGNETVQIFPTVITESFRVVAPREQITVCVRNMSGQVLLQRHYAGNHKSIIEVPVPQLPAGTYLVSVLDGGMLLKTERLIKQGQ